MPKLSEQTLEKRFKCPHCKETLRTRQGLSGHIQFKHPSGTPAEENRNDKVIRETSDFIADARIAGFNEKEIYEMGQILVYWMRIKAVVEGKYTKLNDNDLKISLITTLAQIHANHMLFDRIRDEVKKGQLEND